MHHPIAPSVASWHETQGPRTRHGEFCPAETFSREGDPKGTSIAGQKEKGKAGPNWEAKAAVRTVEMKSTRRGNTLGSRNPLSSTRSASLSAHGMTKWCHPVQPTQAAYAVCGSVASRRTQNLNSKFENPLTFLFAAGVWFSRAPQVRGSQVLTYNESGQ